MKITKEIEVPAKAAHSKTVLDKTMCDVCGKEIKEGDYEINHAAITCEIGEAYPEGGHKCTSSYDMCTTCFLTTFAAWMASHGAVIQQEEFDW